MINWTLERTSNQSHLGVSLQEAKDHLRVSGSGQDDLITLLIQAATEQVERDTARAVLTATWRQSLDKFPEGGEPFDLYQRPVTAVTSVTYVDVDGNTQTLDSSLWSHSTARNKVYYEGSDCQWPQTKETKSDTVFVNFTAGVTDSGCVPRLIKQAILLEVGRAFFDPAQENGVNTNDGRSYEAIVAKLRRSSYP